MSDHDTWNMFAAAALAGLQYHPDEIASVAAATLAKHLPTIKAVQAAAAPVLAGKEAK